MLYIADVLNAETHNQTTSCHTKRYSTLEHTSTSKNNTI